MYTRGQFAVMGNVGIKALRLYHEEGLLIPVYINKDNGYHYYDGSQLITLEKIKQLRKLGASLFEIKQILDGKVSESDIIESRIKETDRLLSELRGYDPSTDFSETVKVDEQIDHRPFQSCRCICICENTEREDLGMSVGKLYERAARDGMEIKGSHFVIFEGLDKDGDFSMKTCLPVTGGADEDIWQISGEKCIHITFRDGFSAVRKAHLMLRDYAAANGIHLADRVYEVYNRDMTVDVYYAVQE